MTAGRQADLDLALDVLDRVERRGDRMTVPAIWSLEVGNVLVRAEKAKQLSADRRTGFLDRLAALCKAAASADVPLVGPSGRVRDGP